jgi:sugar phosphate isomerase/epimerase
MSRSNAVGTPAGMTIALPRLDLESACLALKEVGLNGAEVWIGQLGPLPPSPAHAEAVARRMEAWGLAVTAFNVVGEPDFDPFAGAKNRQRTVKGLARHLVLGHHMGAPTVLIWDGVASGDSASKAAQTLAACIEDARTESGLAKPPAISVEPHPFTFGLATGRLEELAAALIGIGAGICLDFSHFAVGLSESWPSRLSENVLAAVNHIHYSDSDCHTSELHFPPGEGRLDMDAITRLLAGRGVSCGWDLYGWPAPREAMRRGMSSYVSFVEALSAS